MTIIFSDSRDATTDILLHYISDPKKIFRFNFDLFSLYEVTITPTDFVITDPIGRTVNEQSAEKGYYRKPSLAHDVPGEQRYVEEESWTAYRTIIHRLSHEKKMALVEPFAEKGRANKLNQLRVGRRYFQVIDAVFTNRPRETNIEGRVITKSLTGGNVGKKTLYTTFAEPRELAANAPWYLQSFIQATHDVTIVYVGGDCFAFEYDRKNLPEGKVDYRSVDESWDQWRPISTSHDLQQSVSAYMSEMGLHFGRLDFLRDGSELYFLECNPNGQFAWLDPDNHTGLLSRIAQEIS